MNTKVQIEGQSTLEVVEASAVKGMPSLLEKAVIKKDQDGIRVSLIKLDARIHANAVQCLMHAEKHGDTSLMRRLLVDIVDAKSGYRRQGVIGWMRMFSPMELKGDVINLSGVDKDGNKRPWKIEEANRTPFTSIRALDEKVGKPVYRDALTAKIALSIKEFKAAAENTSPDGKPIDKTKPFYDGVNIGKVKEAYEKFEATLVDLQSWRDSTKEAREAEANLKKAQLDLENVKQTA